MGINALELQPVHEFNELEYYGVSQWVHCWVYQGAASGRKSKSVLCKSRQACGATDRLSQPAITRDTPVPVIPGMDEYRFNYWGYSMGGPPAPASR